MNKFVNYKLMNLQQHLNFSSNIYTIHIIKRCVRALYLFFILFFSSVKLKTILAYIFHLYVKIYFLSLLFVIHKNYLIRECNKIASRNTSIVIFTTFICYNIYYVFTIVTFLFTMLILEYQIITQIGKDELQCFVRLITELATR